jgi:hypothetical protein
MDIKEDICKKNLPPDFLTIAYIRYLFAGEIL